VHLHTTRAFTFDKSGKAKRISNITRPRGTIISLIFEWKPQEQRDKSILAEKSIYISNLVDLVVKRTLSCIITSCNPYTRFSFLKISLKRW